MTLQQSSLAGVPFGVGSYTAAEATRLLHIPVLNISRWLKGYMFRPDGVERKMPPLWRTQFAPGGDRLEIGFRDLIELRFVDAFLRAGIGLLTVRNCLAYARECVSDERPFSSRRFQTDGRSIFLEAVEQSGESRLLDLKRRQYVFRQVIDRTFRDLDIEDGDIARWRPYRGKQSIVVDPARSFGQPITARYGVPTIALADAVIAEGSIERVARLYELPASIVRVSVKFEESLQSVS